MVFVYFSLKIGATSIIGNYLEYASCHSSDEFSYVRHGKCVLECSKQLSLLIFVLGMMELHSFTRFH